MQPISNSNNSSQQVIRCLMLGQAGIGKTAFLRHLPNAMQHPPVSSGLNEIIKSTETFSIETIDSKFDKVRIEIECCDLSLQTCLHDTELIVNNKILPSSTAIGNQFINTSKFNVIILCFALHEPSSFQLVKCKWAVDLNKNKKNKHSFVLLGLDSKQNAKKPTPDGKIMATFKRLSPRTKQKQDTYESIESSGSVSINNAAKNESGVLVDVMADDDECIFLDDDLITNMHAPTNYTTAQYKKFAKMISLSSQNFVQHKTEPNINKANVLLLPEIISSQLASYEKFIQSILKSYESLVELKQNSESNGGLVGKIKRSVTAPLTRPLSMLSRNNRSKLGESNTHKESLVMDTNNLTSEKTIKEKVTRFAMNLGTFLVTCGTVKSREMQKLKNEMRIMERESDENYAYYYSSNSSLDHDDSASKPSTQTESTSETPRDLKSNKKNSKPTIKLFKRNRTWQPLTMSGSQLTLNNNSLEDLVIRDD